MTQVSLLVDMKLPRGVGSKAQNHRNSRGWGEYCETPSNRKFLGVGDNLEKNKNGYWGEGRRENGYFLKPHI